MMNFKIRITSLLIVCVMVTFVGSVFALSISDLSIPVPRLRSASFVVKNQRTDELLLFRRADTSRPIASLTKLMTAMTILDGKLDMGEKIVIQEDDKDKLRFSASRLPVGTELTRRETLLLALMASDNRAAHALGRTWPTGMAAFVAAMNLKAKSLGLENTRFVEPTGLSEDNVSTALDLARIAEAAYDYATIRDFTTRQEAWAWHKKKQIHFVNTNALVRNSQWNVGLSKTGYIAAAGRCLVMQVQVKDEPILIVLLNSAEEDARTIDAMNIRQWLEGPKPAKTKVASNINSQKK